MLEVTGVSKYYGALAAVRDVSFTVRPGEVLGYLGPNGSGKSTTVNMVAGLIEPSDGEIRVDGQDIQRNILGHRRRIGYVPETPDLYSYLTGPEYLTLVGRLRRIEPDVLAEKIERFLRLFGIYDDRHARLAAYSKGMRQKVLIAAGLLHDPDIVLLDEPSSGLDVGATLVLKQIIRALAASGKIVLYSSHILEMVEQICSSVVILREGRVVAADRVDPAAVADAPAVAREGVHATRGAGRPGADRRRAGRGDEAVTGRNRGIGVDDEGDQFRVLFRTFLRGLFENDLVPATVDLRQSALWLAAVFMIPPAVFALVLSLSYGSWMTDDELALRAVPQKLYFIGYSMAVVGFVTVLVWDRLFPDRRDAIMLGSLPIPPAQHRCREARGAGRGRGRVRDRGQPARHGALLARCRKLSSVRSVPALPGGPLHRDDGRRPPGVPRPGGAAGVHRPRPSRAPPAAGPPARTTAVRNRPDRMARLRAGTAGEAGGHRPRRDERGAGPRRTVRTSSSG